MFQSRVGFSTIQISLEEEIVGDDIRGNAGLSDEPVKREEIGVLGLPEQTEQNRINCKNGGATVGVDRVASKECGFFQVVLAD